MSDPTVWKASFKAEPICADIISDQLELLSDIHDMPLPTFSWNEIEDESQWTMEAYFTAEPDRAFVQQWLDQSGLGATPFELALVESRDWVSESQKLLAPVSAGRYFIYGEHDRHLARTGKINLQIDAGQAFGTGKHETTSGCLLMLDQLAKGWRAERVLDVGTGSGVLGLAAAKTWRTRVLATDIDPISIEVAAPNAPLNNVRRRRVGEDNWGFASLVADGPHHQSIRKDGPFDLIFANILAAPLVDMAAGLVSHIAPGGYIILAGLLVEQESKVRAAYEARGLYLVCRKQSGNWPTLLLRKAF